MATLLFHRQEREVLRVPCTGPVLRIGRHPANHLTLPDNEISRFHAVLELREDGYWVIDQSTNGTTLNGRRIKASRFCPGDRLGLGKWSILLEEEDSWGERETIVRTDVPSTEDSFHGIIGKSEPMRRVFSMIERSAPTEATILILGETGSGKELVAAAIHAWSPRSRRPFIPLNCGAISPQLIESELFGHERGAFTGAIARHAGAFEQARGGILFLDEVGELPLELQPKLLRVLEERRYRRVGGMEEMTADVRVVAATHRSLETMCRQGRFREDLYFRLHAVPIPIPPLRERSTDIPLLASHFLRDLQSQDGLKTLSDGAMARLIAHPWRGNVRELKNVLVRSVLFSRGEVIGPEEILFLDGDSTDSKPSLLASERQAILTALRENGWNKRRTAVSLGIAKSTLFHKIKEYSITKT